MTLLYADVSENLERRIGVMGLLGTKEYKEHLEKLRAVWTKTNDDDDDDLLLGEMTVEEQLADSLAVFEDDYKFYLHPDGIMPFIYQSKLVVERAGLWTEELQAKYDIMEARYKKYALKDAPPYYEEEI